MDYVSLTDLIGGGRPHNQDREPASAEQWGCNRRMGDGASARTLKTVSLDDKFDLAKDRVFITGTQAHRAPAADAAGARPARRTSTPRASSPAIAARRSAASTSSCSAPRSWLEANDIVFKPGLNEDLAATACWGTQQAEMRGEGKYDGVFCDLVRQGAGRRSHGRRLPPRQHGRHVAASAACSR